MRSVLAARVKMMDEIDKVAAVMSKKTLVLRRRTFQGGIDCIDNCNGDPDKADRCIDDVQKDLSKVSDLATAFGEDVMKRVGVCMEDCMGDDKTAADWQKMEDSTFTAFYTECKVVGSDQERSRLLLCEATRRVLAQCFDILDITPLERI
ncbi:arginyl-tRNA synthetase, putative [Perkinsus marinus ATCC 50983]|uniref:arginine--tRNA ligase n=1 Tax=Perkinsus marinus (strain ATCC 50983 / TXsc) TaxID=423536 RepID=C5M1A8_PERM5|nr:arginyl-tRNA synthetase, putative [Perkinsus marinus ATCC 50983]EEQ97230.1 arginyl-tRNA synthetase, putative [Perkinsus marinus ATCC 50983]|eukprot:XP_002764513.1 arginyl-tRNA synthetase, putative [Perkinsus marinus ATCC 50983]